MTTTVIIGLYCALVLLVLGIVNSVCGKNPFVPGAEHFVWNIFKLIATGAGILGIVAICTILF